MDGLGNSVASFRSYFKSLELVLVTEKLKLFQSNISIVSHSCLVHALVHKDAQSRLQE